jgi:hypothetical protein
MTHKEREKLSGPLHELGDGNIEEEIDLLIPEMGFLEAGTGKITIFDHWKESTLSWMPLDDAVKEILKQRELDKAISTNPDNAPLN